MFDKEEQNMFTLGTFSAFFWTLASIILLMFIFEDKLLALEEKYDRKREAKKRAKKAAQIRNRKTAAQVKRMPEAAKRTNKERRINRNYAA